MVPLGLGILLTITYVNTNTGGNDEPSLATITFLKEGVIGSPYGFPTGPTAHVSPLQIGWMALVYRLFGIYTPAARLVLSGFNALCYLATCALAIGICRRSCRSDAAVWIGTLLSCLVPLTIYDAVVLFRTADQPFGAMVLMLGAYLFLRDRTRPTGGWRPDVILGGLSGIAGLTSPATFPPLFLLAMARAWEGHGWRDRFWRAARAALMVAVFMLPWAIRNQIELGAFIPFRSNFALEFQIGNEDGASGITDTYASGEARTLHPFRSADNTARMAAIGEVAYMRSLQQVAIRWVETHPWQFVGLCVRRAWLSLVPVHGMTNWMPVLHNADVIPRDIIGILEIAGLVLILFGRRDILFWVTIAILPLVPYVLTHTDTRYTSIAFFPSLCVIAVGSDVLVQWGRLAASVMPPTSSA